MAVRPERVPAEEVRRRMLAAGRELALQAGAALTVEHLRLEEVIQRARVPRSSVYRMWPYKDDYVDDLLCHLAGPGSVFADRVVFDPETISVIDKVLTENKQMIATEQGRRALLCEVVRLAAARNYDALSESQAWRFHSALIATLGRIRSEKAREKIAIALEDAHRRSRESMVGLFSYLAGVVGLRMRDPARTAEHIMLVGGLLVQSLALRSVQARAAINDTPDAAHVHRLLNVPVPGPGLDGEPAPWSIVAVSYLAIIDAFAELDPDFVPPDEPKDPVALPRPGGTGEFHHPVAEHRHARQRLVFVVPGLALSQ